MPGTDSREKEIRCILIRMMLDLYRFARARDGPTEETVVQLAVRLGQYEGRPLDTAAIVAITTLPRTSVQRHLKALEDRGRTRAMKVGRRIVRYIPLDTEPPEVTDFYENAKLAVTHACFELSKMGTLPTRHKR